MVSKDSAGHLIILPQLREVLLTVGVVFGFASLLLIIAGAPPLEAYYHLFLGSLSSWVKFTHVVKVWIPLTLCACGLLFTFRIGLWNIGVEGQVMIGSVFTTWVLRAGGDSPDMGPVFIVLSLAAAALGGALWAAVAGFLKTKGGVNEIFAGLGLNFVAQGIVLWLIFGPWKQPGVASMSGTETFPTTLWLNAPALLRIPPVALALVVAALVATGLMLRYTRIGLDLKAVGRDPGAAFLYGLKPYAAHGPGHAVCRRVCRIRRKSPGDGRLPPAHSGHFEQLRLSRTARGDAGELQHLAGGCRWPFSSPA